MISELWFLKGSCVLMHNAIFIRARVITESLHNVTPLHADQSYTVHAGLSHYNVDISKKTKGQLFISSTGKFAPKIIICSETDHIGYSNCISFAVCADIILC